MILPIPCLADISEADHSQWACSTMPGGPAGLEGLQGFGATFRDARRALAEVVALAVTNGLVEELDKKVIQDITHIQLHITTHKTFELSDLLDNTTS